MTAPHPQDDDGHRPLRSRDVPGLVDKAIERAQREGAFDNLPGAGKPLRVDSTDPDWWVKGLMERERLDFSEALPGPLQLRRERSGFPESLLHLGDESAVRERLEDFNARVLADRARPVVGDASPPVVGRVDVGDMVTAWRELRAAAERAGESTRGAGGEGTEGAGDGPLEPSRARGPRWRWWTPWRR